MKRILRAKSRSLSLMGSTMILVGILCAPQLLNARAGGGGGYGGGGGGSFGGGGGGFSSRSFPSGSGRGQSDEFGPQQLAMMLVVMGLIGIAAYYENKQRPLRSQPGWMGDDHRHKNATNNRDHQTNLGHIRQHDPTFNWERFQNRFERAFLKIQNAWQHHQLHTVQHFVSDGISERFALQIKEQQDRGYRDHMDAINVQETRLAGYEMGQAFDTMTIEVTASAVDYRVSLADGSFVSGDRSSASFTEFWSFVRRQGTQTKDRNGLIEGECPNCSAPIQLTQNGHCSACDAIVRSGEYDWVLAEITQACEWQPDKTHNEYSLSQLRQRDPAISVQHIEDRASVIYWRLAMASRTGSAKPLAKVASETYTQWFQEHALQLDSDRTREAYVDCSVGAVEFLGIISQAEYDCALVRIKWAGTGARLRPNNQEESYGRWARRQSYFVLTRHRDSQTQTHYALDSAHCGNCGAPETDLSSHACNYCGETLNTGQHDWVLAENHLHASREAQAWLDRLSGIRSESESPASHKTPARSFQAQFQTSLSEMDLLAGMIVVLASDGTMSESEREVVQHFAEKNGIPQAMVEGLLAAGLQGELEASTPEEPAAGRAWLEALADMALADGTVNNDEKSIITGIGKRYGFVRADIDLILAKRLAQLKKAQAA